MVIIDDISIKKDIMYRISSRHRLLTITISENKRRVTYHRLSDYTILIDIYIYNISLVYHGTLMVIMVMAMTMRIPIAGWFPKWKIG